MCLEIAFCEVEQIGDEPEAGTLYLVITDDLEADLAEYCEGVWYDFVDDSVIDNVAVYISTEELVNTVVSNVDIHSLADKKNATYR